MGTRSSGAECLTIGEARAVHDVEIAVLPDARGQTLSCLTELAPARITQDRDLDFRWKETESGPTSRLIERKISWTGRHILDGSPGGIIHHYESRTRNERQGIGTAQDPRQIATG
jgi:hypothetical protein